MDINIHASFLPHDDPRTIVEMMAKGSYGWILLATPDNLIRIQERR